MKMFIRGSCDIGFLFLNMRIEAYNANYDMELKYQDFETQVERHEENTKPENFVDKSPCVNKNVHTWLV